jgi:ubiquinone/menaquinone biosynthesis C-methylase UbiE
MPRVFEGRTSRIYDFAARTLLRRVYRRLAADVADTAPQDGAVLDVGTGPGVLLVELARRRPDLRLTGLDLSADMVAAAKRNLGPFGDRATARVGNATDLPFPDGSFDLIVSSLSLHHWDHPEAAVPEFARVLKPGGRLCVYDFRFAPFDALTFTGPPAQRTMIRTGVPFFPRLVRYSLTSAL